MKANSVRAKFLDYFSGRGHRRVASSPLVPQDDSTLLFANAGMNQFKRLFTGEEKRDYLRAVSSQKCVRAGGKHNDLENVGYTARHHTFFEMLGNFSFGDYFKEEAILFAWELLTKEYGLPPDRLYFSVYKDDDAAFDLWRKITGVPAGRISRLGEKDNFWAMGDTGPCGPCSEIHIDQGSRIGCGRPDCNPECDCDRFLELWNLVFMQFERFSDGTMKPLPKPSIDTGLGLERVSAICQGVDSNFETDLFTPLIEKVAALTGRPYIYRRELKPGDNGFADNVSTRVLADHARAVTFLINDGVRPENLGRGYVLRRILRRAVRHGRKLGLTRPFLADLSQVLIDGLKDSYPDLAENRAYIKGVVTAEEERFGETLGAGLNMLNSALAELDKKKARVLDGRLAFKLYDTYGFPLDLVVDVAREHGVTVAEDRFQEAMREQKARSQLSWKGGEAEAADHEISALVNSLTAEGFTTRFTGYESLTVDEAGAALLIKDSQRAQEAEKDDRVILVFAATPFYAFSGGQAGDGGEIHFPAGLVEVYDVRKAPGTEVFLHYGVVTEGRFSIRERARLVVDKAGRLATARNHSATHLLHRALRNLFGEEARQAGSLVTGERLRFDFTHSAVVTPLEIEALEREVGEAIRRDLPVTTRIMSQAEAVKTGATALFEERYGEEVRVVAMGDYTLELCGGTHVTSTGRLGDFVITGEGSVAAGVRRFEALTGAGALEFIQRQRRQLAEILAALKARPEEAVERIARLQVKARELGEKAPAQNLATALAGRAVVEKEGVKLLAAEVTAADPKALRALGDELKNHLGPTALIGLGASTASGKAMLLVMVGPALAGRFRAGEIISRMAAEIGGQGGGRDDLAQAGGPDPAGLPAALEIVAALV